MTERLRTTKSDVFEQLRADVADYVRAGGRDAFSFSLTYHPRYGDVPGCEIQRLIDEETKK
ncbi:hypothetical protein ACFOQM_23535 [Paenibacillus sp. GCM10012307]|uniref:Uncharacterized protein n=1 Tax=Paenibacillus roseus TaxID=2798579 RepID=A0A934MRF1_9BACL|nr:hypothetical protein [Paenibacillus roseus]MBJ6364196.1 hypothetical protein [Paenibacillus roseus]